MSEEENFDARLIKKSQRNKIKTIDSILSFLLLNSDHK